MDSGGFRSRSRKGGNGIADTILAPLVVVKLVTAKSVSSRLYPSTFDPTGPYCGQHRDMGLSVRFSSEHKLSTLDEQLSCGSDEPTM